MKAKKLLLVPHTKKKRKKQLAMHTDQLMPPQNCQFLLSTMEAIIDAQGNIMQY
jgi:hypothetical protein